MKKSSESSIRARRFFLKPKASHLGAKDRKIVEAHKEEITVSKLKGDKKIVTDFLYGHAKRVLEATGRGQIILHREEANDLLKELNANK